ncbi:MAG: hypothetical protein QW395_05950 [Candidatus Nitrosotenuis sp.]
MDSLYSFKPFAKNEGLLLNMAKILLICFVSYFLLGNIEPFYEGRDAYTHALASINFSHGQLERTNSLLQETGLREFAGDRWLVTDFNTAVPRIPGIGIVFFGGISFLLGGYYGLFYLTPIFTIILLIVSERVATKLFGRYVGLFTLLVVGTSNLVFRNSTSLQTESLFSVFFILASFYFVRYLRGKNNLYLLLASCLFAASTAVRLQGVVSFPVEIAVVVGFFAANVIQKRRGVSTNQRILGRKSDVAKALVYIAIPWIIFFASYMAFFDYYFGNPFTNYGEVANFKSYETSPSSFTTIRGEDLDNVKQYSKYLFPYQIPATFDRTDNNLEGLFGSDWLGVAALLVIAFSLLVSLRMKKHRLEMILFLPLIFATVWFYSSLTSEDRAASGVPGRFMIPAFILSTMVFGFLLREFTRVAATRSVILRSSRVVVVGVVGLFLIAAIYFSSPAQIAIADGLDFEDPSKLSARYPLDMEGLDKNSVIFLIHADWAVDYGVIPFQPNPTKLEESFSLLKQVLNDGYSVYTFKETTYEGEKEILRSLTENYGIVLREHSKTFCKMEVYTDASKSDIICLTNSDME